MGEPGTPPRPCAVVASPEFVSGPDIDPRFLPCRKPERFAGGFLIVAKGFPFEFPIVDDGAEPSRGETRRDGGGGEEERRVLKGIEFEIPDEEKSPGENRILRGKDSFFGVEYGES